MLSLYYLHFAFPLHFIFLYSFQVKLKTNSTRAVRIYKVLSYYKGYWLLMKHYGEESEVAMSNYLTKEENIMLSKSKKWRENSLIAFIIFNLLVPLFILSMLSFTTPYIYTIIPVYETQTCWNYFY